VILTSDEAALYLQATLQRVWAPVGQTPVIQADPGRKCTHFYGTLNLQTGEEIVLRSDVMNAQVSALHLQQLLVAYPGVPILLFWDRAPWHKGAPIRSVLAANPRLEVVWFPPASPELNPQEHVWKATREAISHNHQYVKLPELADAFERHLKTTEFPCSLLDKHGYHTLCIRSK
jgi:putative transposase